MESNYCLIANHHIPEQCYACRWQCFPAAPEQPAGEPINAAPQEEASLQALGRQSACVPPVASAPVAELIELLRKRPHDRLCVEAADALAAMDTRYAALWLWCDGHSKIIDMHKQRITELEAQLATERAECLEQCRLLAMGGEREARLMAENAALLEWESRCAIALGVPGCAPEEMLNVIDSQLEDAERYRYVREKPAMLLHLSNLDFDAAINAARKK
jgi:hypothetical protein